MRFHATFTYYMAVPITAADTAALAGALGAGALASGGPDGILAIEHDVDAPALPSALGVALFDVNEALQAVGLRNRDGLLEPVAATVAEADWHTAHIVTPGMPATVQITAAAAILGVSQQRASQLAESDPAFPAPLNPDGRNKIYAETALRAYAAARPRKPGRPKRTAD